MYNTGTFTNASHEAFFVKDLCKLTESPRRVEMNVEMNALKALAVATLLATILLFSTASAEVVSNFENDNSSLRRDGWSTWYQYPDTGYGTYYVYDDYHTNTAHRAVLNGETIEAHEGEHFLLFSNDYIQSATAVKYFEAEAGDELSLWYSTKWDGWMPDNDNFAVWAESWSLNEMLDEWTSTTLKLVSTSLLDGDSDWTFASTILPHSGYWSLYGQLVNVGYVYNENAIAGIDDIQLSGSELRLASASAVPIPAPFFLFGSAMAGFAFIRRRKSIS